MLDRIRGAPFAPQRELYDLAAKQLRTVASGNHYVNLFAGERGIVWVGVHFGSRGFGHRTATGFLAVAQGLRFSETWAWRWPGATCATPTRTDAPAVLPGCCSATRGQDGGARTLGQSLGTEMVKVLRVSPSSSLGDVNVPVAPL